MRPWHVGAAKVVITPEQPVWLAGYSRDGLSEGVHDDVWARALAIGNGEKTVLILTVDLIGLFLTDVNDVRDALATVELPRDHIIITSTHNHSGPDMLGLWHGDRGKSGVDFVYLEHAKALLVAAGTEALMKRQPAQLTVSRVNVQGISMNHRDTDLVDRETVTLRASGTFDRTIATLTNFACHPEVLNGENKQVTSDMAHYFYKQLESQYGGVALWVNGALGGMVSPLVSERTFKEAERCGVALADSVISGFASEIIVEGPLKSVRSEIRLPMENPLLTTLTQAGIIHRAIRDTVETEVGIVRVGQLMAVTIPGEALPKIGFALKDAINSPYKMVWGLANDELGYLIAGEDWQPNEYEESMSVGPKAGDQIREALVELIRQDP